MPDTELGLAQPGSALPPRRSVDQRLRNWAQAHRVDPMVARRRLLYQRLLARMDATHPLHWLLRGGRAIDYRLEGQSRATRDIDVALLLGDAIGDEQILRERLAEVLATDLGDGFRFALTSLQPGREGGAARVQTYSITIHADYCGQPFDVIPVDATVDRDLCLPADVIRSDGMAGFAAIRVAVVSVEQQIAEKIHAMTRRHGENLDKPSTRPHDLVDMMALARRYPVDPTRLGTALQAVFETWGTHPLPERLEDPPPSWESAFTRYGPAYGLQSLRVGDAMAEVRALYAAALASTPGPKHPGQVPPTQTADRPATHA